MPNFTGQLRLQIFCVLVIARDSAQTIMKSIKTGPIILCTVCLDKGIKLHLGVKLENYQFNPKIRDTIPLNIILLAFTAKILGRGLVPFRGQNEFNSKGQVCNTCLYLKFLDIPTFLQ